MIADRFSTGPESLDLLFPAVAIDEFWTRLPFRHRWDMLRDGCRAVLPERKAVLVMGFEPSRLRRQELPQRLVKTFPSEQPDNSPVLLNLHVLTEVTVQLLRESKPEPSILQGHSDKLFDSEDSSFLVYDPPTVFHPGTTDGILRIQVSIYESLAVIHLRNGRTLTQLDSG